MGDSGTESQGGATLVGRRAELAALTTALDSAVAGRGRLALISGEPGIGKSRLADELSTVARARGARVLWGRCWEAGGAPAYWPWVQSMRSYVRAMDEKALRRHLGASAGDVAQLVPEVADIVGTEVAVAGGDSEAARFRLFDAVTSFIVAASSDQPIVLILDDLQAADVPSLLLLRFVAGEVQHGSVLLAGTYRDVELDRDHPLTATVADLTRNPSTVRIHLRGLDRTDVARYVEAVTGVRPTEAAVAALDRETEGNPLFVGEVARLAAAEGRLDERDPAYWERVVPQGVREVIGRRIDRLSKECARTLSLASILGREFSVDALRELSGVSIAELEEVLDEAASARVVTEVPGSPNRLRFAHALIRDTLYDELLPTRRARHHQRAGEVLVELYGGDEDAHAAELAHHFFHAGTATEAVEYARRAADGALAQLAYEEAIRLYRMALTAMERTTTHDPSLRCELLLGLGDARARAGDLDEAREQYLQAADVARGVGRSDVLAHAAMGYGGRFVWPRAGTDPHMIPLLEEALRALGDQDTRLRVRLLARLAGAKRDEPDRAARDALSAEAVEIARRIGDPGALAYALTGRWAAMLGPRFAPGRGDDPAELVAAVQASGDPELAFEGRLHAMLEALTDGDAARAMRLLDEMDRIAGVLQQPAQRWAVAAGRATFGLLQGRFDEAEAATAEAATYGERSQSWDAVVFARMQSFALRREQGRLDEVVAAIDDAVHECPTRPVFRCMQAVAAVELGDRDRAQAIVDDLARDGFRQIPLNNDWSLSVSLLSDVVHALGDRRHAETLVPLLAPSESAVVETLELSTGAMARSVGLLELTAGRADEAVRLLRRAVDINAGMDAAPWVARSKHDLATALIARGDPGDGEAATVLLQEALATARSLGQAGLEPTITEAMAGVGVAPGGEAEPGPATAAPAERGVGTFRREGDYWLVAYGGRHVRLQDAKGLQYLATLVQHPGREIHAMDLVAAGAGVRGGDSGEVLDDRARAAYRQRVEDLQAEIEEADAWNDAARSARAHEELEFLVRELAAAAGLGGRARRAGSDAERARVNATRAIRSAVGRITEHDRELGALFDRTIRTGTFCVYEPDGREPVRWSG